MSNFSSLLPLLVVSVYTSLLLTKGFNFYDQQRHRGDVVAVPENLCRPDRMGTPLFPYHERSESGTPMEGDPTTADNNMLYGSELQQPAAEARVFRGEKPPRDDREHGFERDVEVGKFSRGKETEIDDVDDDIPFYGVVSSAGGKEKLGPVVACGGKGGGQPRRGGGQAPSIDTGAVPQVVTSSSFYRHPLSSTSSRPPLQSSQSSSSASTAFFSTAGASTPPCHFRVNSVGNLTSPRLPLMDQARLNRCNISSSGSYGSMTTRYYGAFSPAAGAAAVAPQDPQRAALITEQATLASRIDGIGRGEGRGKQIRNAIIDMLRGGNKMKDGGGKGGEPKTRKGGHHKNSPRARSIG